MNLTDSKNQTKTIMAPESILFATVYGVNGLRLANKQAISNKIDKLIIHNMYNKTKIDDIALIKLVNDIEFKANRNRFIVNAVCLPTKNNVADSRVVFAGWGRTSMDNNSDERTIKLQRTEYNIINERKCRKILLDRPWDNKTLREQVSQFAAAISSNFFCILTDRPPGAKWVNQSNTANSGDSGSPLLKYYNGRAHAIGVASFIVKEEWNIPINFFLSTSNYIDWIKRQIRANQGPPSSTWTDFNPV